MRKLSKQAKKDSLNWLPENLINTELISFGAKKVLNALQSYRLATPAAESNIIVINRDKLTEIAHISARDVIHYTQELEQYNLLIKIAGKKKFENGSKDAKGIATKYFLLEDNWDKELKKIAFNEIVENRKKLLQLTPTDEDGRVNGTVYYNKLKYNIVDYNMLSDDIVDDDKIIDDNKVIEVERTTTNTEDNDQLNNNFINNIKDFDNMLNDITDSSKVCLEDNALVETETNASNNKRIEVRSIETNKASKSDESHDQASLNPSLFLNKEIIEELGKELVAARSSSDYWKEYVKLINAAWEKANKKIHELQGSKEEMVVTFYEALYTLNEETTRFNHVLMPSVDEQKVIEEEYLNHLDNPKELLAKANQEKNLRVKFFVFKLKTIKEKTLEILTSKLPTQ